MGLKCSVLGHSYGDVSVERDRAEQGSEVVITIREIETCARCGTERVVSENKEVTSIATPDEPETAEEGPDAANTSEATGSSEDQPAPPDLDPATDEPDIGESPETAVSPAPSDGSEGAEILDADASEPVTDDELADPSIQESESPEEPLDESESDAVFVDADDDTEGRKPGEWPDEPAGEPDDAWEPDAGGHAEETAPSPDVSEPDRSGAVTVPDGQFHCPECGFTTAVESSSLRAGDFCPECHTGTLVHDGGE
jgi:ssDNA-binding Zn-finger/Zn-ribbon topoisomerase 1